MAAPGSGVGELHSGVRALDVHVCAVARPDLVAVAEGVNARRKQLPKWQSQHSGTSTVMWAPAGRRSPAPTVSVMTNVWPLAASTSFGVIAASMSTGGKSCQARVMPLIQALESSKIRAAGIAVFSLVWGDMR